MSDENNNQEQPNEVGARKVSKAGFRSPYSRSVDERLSYPRLLTCKPVNFNEIIDDVNRKIENLTVKIRNSESEVEIKKLSAELNELKHYKDNVDFISKGHFAEDGIDPFNELNSWTQALLLDDKTLGIIPKKISAETDENGVISNVASVEAMFSKELNVGTPSDIFLPDTNIVVRIGSIEEDSIIDLMEMLAILRNDVGFAHKGALFTATDSKIVCAIVEFCLSHVTGSTLETTSMENLMRVFKITDAQALAAGTLKSIYPEGYPFLHACINKDSCTFKTYNEGNVEDGTIETFDYGRVIWYDVNKFSGERLEFSSVPFGTHSVEEVLAHQEKYLQPKIIGPINNTGKNAIKLKIQIPNYMEYRDTSFSWIGSVVSTVEEVLKTSSTGSIEFTVRKKRGQLIREKIFNLRLQKYLPWVEEVILINNETGKRTIAKGTESVKAALGSMSKVNDIKVNAPKIINRETLKLSGSLAGIPMFECPECGTINQSKNADGKPMSILARNIIADFFYTMELKRLA